jgi:hypothetical protein
MRNIHILPTDKPSILYAKDDNYKLANSTMAMDWYISSVGYKPYNIYITSDEEIKDGDFIYSLSSDEIIFVEKGEASSLNKIVCKKIILTDNKYLIKNGVQLIGDEFLEWFVKNPSCERVDVEVDEYRDTSISDTEVFTDYKIIIPKEEVKKETLEEFAKKQWGNVHRTGVLGFIEGAKWQQEQDKNNYSEVFEWLANKDYLSDEVDIIQKEFEQFKKK